MKTQVYKELSSRIKARQNCIDSGNDKWYDNHGTVLDHLVNNYLPSGSGIDSGCTIDNQKSDNLIIYSSFHKMDDNGMYDGWIDFTVRVKPSLIFGTTLTITGNFGKHQDIGVIFHLRD